MTPSATNPHWVQRWHNLRRADDADPACLDAWVLGVATTRYWQRRDAA
ncbi:hypothetical protein [Acrocarpospora sp. B8E8]